ncbi:MAG TPA: alanine--tRNA ligase, partial [Acidimicrobiia bacterium]|nr:alanine--tRNA ligase [Acidimicrobiia bacterium]
MPPTTADQLRRAFTEFFAAREHTVVPSASLIPHDRTLLFTVAGMVPFKPYFVGEETPPYKRATSVQKCVRAGGKHNDLDDIGRTNRHFSFFEMLGHFSFGDYFKAEAIPWAWELVTEGFGIDPDRLWVTVHESDDDAEQIWREVVGIPAERVQRLGDANFWRMADTGPCGPCTEIFYDLGPEHGRDGGPAQGGEDRFLEFWNTVFMQYDQRPDGTRVDLPAPSVDCGVGLERTLMLLQGHTSIWEIDLFRPLIETAERATSTRYGGDGEDDVSLRIMAEHGRTMAFLVSDGVVPSNEERGYVLRRIIRRAVRHAYRLGGAEQLVTPALAEATVDVMGDAFPELVKARDLVVATVTREEERFRRTLRRGVELLDDKLETGDVTGDDAFFLHDTLGFPIDLTREIAEERGRTVDLQGFEAAMAKQRTRAQQAHREAGEGADTAVAQYREVLDEFGPTEFTGRQEYETTGARVLALLAGGERVARAGKGDVVDVVLDRTPFYPEAGGQVGDTGTIITTSGAELRVTDT